MDLRAKAKRSLAAFLIAGAGIGAARWVDGDLPSTLALILIFMGGYWARMVEWGK